MRYNQKRRDIFGGVYMKKRQVFYTLIVLFSICLIFIACSSRPQIDTQNTPPQNPTNPSPENNATGITTEATLTWNCSDPDGDSLIFQVFLASHDNNLALIADQITENSFPLTNLEPGCTYRWQVIANDNQADQQRALAQGPVWRFHTQESPVEEDNIFYCSVTGSNSNNGSIDKPWQTPGYAVRQLHPGDTLIIKEGEYILNQYPDDILIIPSGTVEKPIIVKGEGIGKTILKGDDNLFAMIILNNVSHITISDIELTNNDSGWIRDGITGGNGLISAICIKNIFLHHIDEFGINLQNVNGLDIENSTITYCGFGAIGGPFGEVGWQNCSVINCSLSFSGHYYRGLNDNPDLPYDRPDGIGLEPSIGPVNVIDCKVEHNRGDGIDLKTENSFVSKCIVANNYGDGIKLWGNGTIVENSLIYGTGDGNMQSPWCPLVIEQSQVPNSTFIVKNCTIHDNPQRPSYSIYSQYNDPTPLNLTIINCTFSDSYGMAYFGENVDLTIKHSNFYAPNRDGQIIYKGIEYTAQDLQDCSFGEGIISTDPQFINPVWGMNTGQYKLKPTSPLIDAGTSENAPEEDLESTPRPQGNETDIGAFEQ